MKVEKLLAGFTISIAAFIIKVADLGAQEGALLVDAQNLEAAQALGEDVETSVLVTFDDIEDLGGAADLCHLFLPGMDDAKDRVALQALTDHLFVARLEDVQRQWDGGKQDQRQRKNWQQALHPHIVRLTPKALSEYKT